MRYAWLRKCALQRSHYGMSSIRVGTLVPRCFSLLVGLMLAVRSTAASLAFTSVLTPLPPFDSEDPEDYNAVVFRTLIGNKYTDGWMVVKPSFFPEYAVVINRNLTNAKAGMSLDAIPFQAELVTVKTMIWNYDRTAGGSWTLAPRKDQKVERARVDLSTADAASFLDGWFTGLGGVRYRDELSLGNDGVTFDFHAKDRYGSTWSPEDGPAIIQRGKHVSEQ